MNNLLSLILNYLPSFLSRYYLQVMLIALPWILQNQYIAIDEISYIIGIFFWGSILSSLVFAIYAHKLNTIKWLKSVLLLLSLISIICFFTLNFKILLILRFFQGCLNGLLRPLNQIWLQDRAGLQSSAHDLSKNCDNKPNIYCHRYGNGSIGWIIII